MNDELTLEDWAIVFWRNPWWVGFLMRVHDHTDAEIMRRAHYIHR